MGIQLIIDSSSDYSVEEAKKEGLLFVPIPVMFDGKTYLDGETLTKDMLYDRLIQGHFPTTSQPTPSQYAAVFRQVEEAGDEGILITIASTVSGTYQSAMLAARDFPSIHVVDSGNGSLGGRLLMQEAERLVAEGRSVQEVLEELDQKKKRLYLFGVVPTLTYLQRSGRISAAQKFLGNILSVKPILRMHRGKFEVVGKARGMKNALRLLAERILQTPGVNLEKLVYAFTGNDPALAEEQLASMPQLPRGKSPLYRVGTAIGAHMGPGTLAISFFAEN